MVVSGELFAEVAVYQVVTWPSCVKCLVTTTRIYSFSHTVFCELIVMGIHVRVFLFGKFVSVLKFLSSNFLNRRSRRFVVLVLNNLLINVPTKSTQKSKGQLMHIAVIYSYLNMFNQT
jgi:hypothetical protein